MTEPTTDLSKMELWAHCVFGDEVPKNTLESF